MIQRADIVRVALTYVGTPFHHMGRLPGVGLDCVGVPICACRDTGAVAPDFDIPSYGPIPDGHTMMEWCIANLRRVQQTDMQAGDMIVLATDKDPQHIGILSVSPYGGLSIIHSSNAVTPPRVIEHRLLLGRGMRFVAAFALPGVE